MVGERPIDVGEPKRDGRQPEGAGAGTAVRLTAQLARPVRRDRTREGPLVHRWWYVAHDRTARRRKYDFLDACLDGGVEHGQRTAHVDVEVLERLPDRLRHGADGREVH